MITLSVQIPLPSSLSCSQCILQYTYTASEHWGAGPQSASISTRVRTSHHTSEYLTFPDLILGLSESQAEAGLR